MRIHITLDDVLVARLDSRVGRRRRSAFIAESVRRVLDDESRWDGVMEGLGSIEDGGHAWDEDPGAWVRQQRTTDPSRVG